MMGNKQTIEINILDTQVLPRFRRVSVTEQSDSDEMYMTMLRKVEHEQDDEDERKSWENEILLLST